MLGLRFVLVGWPQAGDPSKEFEAAFATLRNGGLQQAEVGYEPFAPSSLMT